MAVASIRDAPKIKILSKLLAASGCLAADSTAFEVAFPIERPAKIPVNVTGATAAIANQMVVLSITFPPVILWPQPDIVLSRIQKQKLEVFRQTSQNIYLIPQVAV